MWFEKNENFDEAGNKKLYDHFQVERQPNLPTQVVTPRSHHHNDDDDDNNNDDDIDYDDNENNVCKEDVVYENEKTRQ